MLPVTLQLAEPEPEASALHFLKHRDATPDTDWGCCALTGGSQAHGLVERGLQQLLALRLVFSLHLRPDIAAGAGDGGQRGRVGVQQALREVQQQRRGFLRVRLGGRGPR